MKVTTRARAILPPLFLGVLVSLVLLALLSSYPTKEEWLRAQANQLLHLKITPEMIAKARPWQDGGRRYMLGGASGVIPIGDNDAVYVVTHSFHDYDSHSMGPLKILGLALTGRRHVSDATILVDRGGHLYTSEGHICGGLTVWSGKEVKTMQDFLETYSYEPSDEKNKWKPYQPD